MLGYRNILVLLLWLPSNLRLRLLGSSLCTISLLLLLIPNLLVPLASFHSLLVNFIDEFRKNNTGSIQSGDID